ncbi:PIG-L deacetylase family protein [Micromonospora peucetia]|uniref:PIG-L family deacetylase n=1 Tax=Micromonospora peucetia TaxID=47871 RepID=A0ABZ1EJY7_9ACTN|nr:PIG-L family deacetylase [Micromonospora peucetia]WSA34558.1 PIG-L family deacetylase [Micromonospora peucetia]
MGRPVIFCVPHPDDETLGAGVSIAEHVAAGRDVRILLMTRGTGSGAIRKVNGTNWSPWWGVWHNPAVEGYQPLGEEEFGASRMRELMAAIGCLGVSAEHVYEASALLGEPVLDGSVTQDQARRAILALAATLDPAAGHPGLWTPTWLVDDNPDHIAVGKASRQLGVEDPVWWGDRRYWVLPPYWQDARLGQIAGEFWDTPNNAGTEVAIEIQRRARNACLAYKAWAPQQGMYAIGYHSVDGMFAAMDGSTSTNPPKCLIHK